MSTTAAPETVPTSGTAVAPVRPGYCAEHPAQALVTHHQANERRWGEDPATVCVMCIADQNHSSRERCRWCGGPLVPPGTRPWFVSERRAYCTPGHRLRAFRARQREGVRP